VGSLFVLGTRAPVRTTREHEKTSDDRRLPRRRVSGETPRFHMHFTPTGSSWINQVERWFGFLTEQKIRRGAHKSVPSLEADIRSRITAWNSDPRPFIWTKTAEEILESLTRFCRRISGAAH
jgi:hypothetical protein